MNATAAGERWQVTRGDCLDVLRGMADESIDAIVTDPPAGISFMGKKWDGDKGGKVQWIAWMQLVAAECLRVLKPGGHAVVWALPRTSHWTGTAWEDAGFQVREIISHIFSQGFPKSLNVSKQIDRQAGIERDVIGKSNGAASSNTNSLGEFPPEYDATAPATPEAQQWDGWHTALKPAVEMYWLLRKPLSERTVAANVLRWGTGALNIGATRVSTNGEAVTINTWDNGAQPFGDGAGKAYSGRQETEGRYPANLVHSGESPVVALFPVTGGGGGQKKGSIQGVGLDGVYGDYQGVSQRYYPASKSKNTARFFQTCPPDEDPALVYYHPKANKRDRGEGNTHISVKPVSLMRWLCRLVTQPGGVVLDPFMGSGTTGEACIREGFRFEGIEMQHVHFDFATARLARVAGDSFEATEAEREGGQQLLWE